MSETEAQELKIYEVTNRETGEKHFAASNNADEACKQAGWLIGDCFVREGKPKRTAAPGQKGLLLVRLPCQTCPYQYSECLKPDEKICPIRPDAPELHAWLKQATKAHLCHYQGTPLRKKDHALKQKWLPMEEAIKELSSKSPKAPLDCPQPTCLTEKTPLS